MMLWQAQSTSDHRLHKLILIVMAVETLTRTLTVSLMADRPENIDPPHINNLQM